MKKTAEIKRAVYTWCLSSGLLEKLASDDTDVKLPTHSLPLLTHPIAGGAAATAVAKRTLDTAARDGARNFLYATGVAMPRPLGFSGKEHIYRAMVEQMPGITYGRNFNALGNGYGGLGYRTSKEIYETLRKANPDTTLAYQLKNLEELGLKYYAGADKARAVIDDLHTARLVNPRVRRAVYRTMLNHDADPKGFHASRRSWGTQARANQAFRRGIAAGVGTMVATATLDKLITKARINRIKKNLGAQAAASLA